jgi:glycolate oxidase
MALTRENYRELEDILGSENISEDEAILDGYAFQPLNGALQGKRFFRRPEAVVLPGSTKEVQAIIKVCNRRGIREKAFSTGFGLHNIVGSEGTIILDLRRMNRILDIDEKNMTILVEPYVSFAQVQSEAIKRGLTCNVLGAGSQVSYLASLTSLHGNNSQAVSQGYSGRNLLGVEWVSPTGDIVRLGAPGSGAGWFTGDGPGPSLRGILRGACGAAGGLGVFTKCAGHLHPWVGPEDIVVQGNSPYYETDVPPHFEYHLCEFPTWEKFGEAMAKIGAAGIALALHKSGGPGTHGHCVTGNNNEYYEKRLKGELEVPWKSFSIVMAAANEEEHAWQVKVLNKILEETGGTIVALGEDPTWKKRDILTMIKACFIPRLAFRPSGTFAVDGMIGMDTTGAMALGLTIDEKHRNKWNEKGIFVDDGTLNNWAITYEGSHFALFECGYQFSSINSDSIKGYNEMMAEGFNLCYQTPFNLSWAVFGEAEMPRIGPACGNHHLWMKKIKKTFDPNTVSDPSMYISGD